VNVECYNKKAVLSQGNCAMQLAVFHTPNHSVTYFSVPKGQGHNSTGVASLMIRWQYRSIFIRVAVVASQILDSCEHLIQISSKLILIILSYSVSKLVNGTWALTSCEPGNIVSIVGQHWLWKCDLGSTTCPYISGYASSQNQSASLILCFCCYRISSSLFLSSKMDMWDTCFVLHCTAVRYIQKNRPANR